MEALKAGARAPEFELHATPDQRTKLTDVRGQRVVLAFYPADWSPVCGDQLALYNELRDEFSCEGGKVQGGANLAGICEKAVDAIVRHAIDAKDRETLATAGRALDRLLLNGWYMVPNWHDSKFKIATWNRFGRPEAKIRDGFVLDSWWIDPALAAKTDAARR